MTNTERIQANNAELQEILETVNALPDAGEGGDGWYDTFWDAFQQNGARTGYAYGLAGPGWTNEIFIPKYPIVVVGDASYMFNACGLTDFDFVEKGVSIDFSGMTRATYLFRDCSGIKRIGVFDCRGCKDVNRPFYGSGIQTIDSFVVTEATIYDNTFAQASKLENITISGTIGKSISFADSAALTATSAQSIIDHLKDLTGGTAQTLTFHAKVGAKLTDAQKAAIAAKNWTVAY